MAARVTRGVLGCLRNDRGILTTSSPRLAPPPSCANNSGTGSRWHPWASAGGRLLRCTSNHRTGCSRIPRRNRNRRGGEARGFLTDYSWTGPFSACGINAAQSGNAISSAKPNHSSPVAQGKPDLAPTTDLRAVFKGVLHDHLGLSETALAQTVFPDSAAARPMKGLLG